MEEKNRKGKKKTIKNAKRYDGFIRRSPSKHICKILKRAKPTFAMLRLAKPAFAHDSYHNLITHEVLRRAKAETEGLSPMLFQANFL